MSSWIKWLVVLIIIFSALSFVWFLLGSTAYFQRGMDIVGTTYVLLVGIPCLLGTILYTLFLIKGVYPTRGVHHIGFLLGLVILIILSTILIYGVNSSGWAKDKIESDSLKITVDGKYEYCINLINLFQRNSKAELYLRDVGTGEEKIIPVDIHTRRIKTLAVGKVNNWVTLEPTTEPSRYNLSTTKDIRIPTEKFEIDIRVGTSSRIN